MARSLVNARPIVPRARRGLLLRIVSGFAWALCLSLAAMAPDVLAVLPDGTVTASQAAPMIGILVYHRFAASADDSMTVRVVTFEAQLAFLREHGYRIVPLADIVAWLRDRSATLPPKAVAVTVDDGHRSVYDVMMPIVVRERIPVTLFVYPSAISNAPYALSWDQLRALKATGFFDVQSHTWWHPNFDVEERRRSPDAFRRFATTQFTHSRDLIEREVGGHVDMIAWPFGIHDDELVELAQSAGYVAGVTIEGRRLRRSDALLSLPRFLMVDGCTPRVLGRLLGETETRPPADGERQ
ncbi:polysaccharide deacetylase family protein [Paraburkholderia rhizosphaerae]|uniref:Polysaccharide deacetylase n=1 Tax=Paraburkholderia rhizosphaerae TaxID=480658 RepID=A0A4R8LUY4_9BURK|nr:polysaccharide deacetylase family protein [Paraburkholderia rhizosphaerae]TDY50942.1 polysaccharide deacetylase [Paraburkholderia rhizosphaerae]